MKSVGEVMAIGRNIEEVLQKALRSLDIGMLGLVGNPLELEFKDKDLDRATPKRIFAIARAFIKGKSIDYVHKKTHIDHFFLGKMKNIADTRKELLDISGKTLLSKDKNLITQAKKQGFSDIQIGHII